MITGVPNVGKSTIINALAKAAAQAAYARGRGAKGGRSAVELGTDEYRPASWDGAKARRTPVHDHGRSSRRSGGTTKHLAKVGDRPGVTRAVASILVSVAPALVRVLDTPGIMLPKVSGPEQGLKLSLTGAVRDEVRKRLFCACRERGQTRKSKKKYSINNLYVNMRPFK
jgi:ribosome biogenesis GTPase A